MERHRLGALPATLAERLLTDAMAKWVTLFSVKIFNVSTCKNIVEVRQPAGYPASAAGLPGAGGERGAAEEPLHPPLPLPLAHRQDTVSTLHNMHRGNIAEIWT